jgi:hypothetical protein
MVLLLTSSNPVHWAATERKGIQNLKRKAFHVSFN